MNNSKNTLTKAYNFVYKLFFIYFYIFLYIKVCQKFAKKQVKLVCEKKQVLSLLFTNIHFVKHRIQLVLV